MGWQKDRARQVGELETHLRDIQAKLDEALAALGKVSMGYGEGDHVDHRLNIQRLAANSLVRIGKMRQRQKPYIYWSI